MDEKRPVVVCVDDEPQILASLRRQLRQEPYELLLTQDPVQALAWISERSVALVISDQRMPRLSGVELLDAVRDHSPATSCMLLSGFPDTARDVERAELPVDRLLLKPWDAEELKASIRGVLGKREPEDEEDVELRVDCAGKSARQVIAEILSATSRARSRRQRPVVDLAELPRLNDSLSRLLKDLARAVAWFRLPVDLRDGSGCLAAFLEAMAGPAGRLGKRPMVRRSGS
jgi:DNA-binding NtrC family response regulator